VCVCVCVCECVCVCVHEDMDCMGGLEPLRKGKVCVCVCVRALRYTQLSL